MADDDQIERIRSKLVDFIGSNQSHPDAEQARRILGKLPKVQKGGALRGLQGPAGTVDPSPSGIEPSPGISALANVREEFGQPGPGVGKAVQNVAGAVNSFADRASFGLFGAAMKAASKLGVPSTGEAADSIEQYRGDNPNISQITDAPAYLVGPSKALATGLEAAVPQVASKLARAGRAGVIGGATSGVVAGSESAARGESPREALEDAGAGAAGGLAAGTALGGVGGLLTSAARAVIGSKGAQSRQLLESRGVNVGVRSAGDNGPLAGSPSRPTDADIGQQAERSAATGLEMLRGKKRAEVSVPYREEVARVRSSGEAANLRDVRPIYSQLAKAYYDPGTDPGVSQNIKRLMDLMDERYTRSDGSILMTEEHLNGLRRSLNRMSKSGVSADEKLMPLQDAANLAQKMTSIGPFQEANRAYAQGSHRFQRDRRLLGITERPRSPEETRQTVDTLKNRITRRGQNTVTAGGQRGGMDEFAERHPDIAAEFEKPELLRAKADLSFNLTPPHHGGMIERLGGAMGLGAAIPLAAFAHSPGHAAGALLGGLALQNASPIAGRLLYNPARAIMAAEPLLTSDIPRLQSPLLDAARRAQQER